MRKTSNRFFRRTKVDVSKNIENKKCGSKSSDKSIPNYLKNRFYYNLGNIACATKHFAPFFASFTWIERVSALPIFLALEIFGGREEGRRMKTGAEGTGVRI